MACETYIYWFIFTKSTVQYYSDKSLQEGTLKTTMTRLMASSFLTLMLMLVACSSNAVAPVNVQLELAIQDGKMNVDGGVIRVKQGDNVTFSITSDQSGGFHLHGYNYVVDVGPDEIEKMKFEADATGRFLIKLHPFGVDHSEHNASAKVGDVDNGHEDEKHHDKSEDTQHMEEQHEESDGHEEEEITLATLEVLPR